MPFDDNLPFEATITEQDIPDTSSKLPPKTEKKTLCWMKTTYKEHDLKQTIANLYMAPEERRKEERGEGDYNTWGFRRWDMEVSLFFVVFLLVWGRGGDGGEMNVLNLDGMVREDASVDDG